MKDFDIKNAPTVWFIKMLDITNTRVLCETSFKVDFHSCPRLFSFMDVNYFGLPFPDLAITFLTCPTYNLHIFLILYVYFCFSFFILARLVLPSCLSLWCQPSTLPQLLFLLLAQPFMCLYLSTSSLFLTLFSCVVMVSQKPPEEEPRRCWSYVFELFYNENSCEDCRVWYGRER